MKNRKLTYIDLFAGAGGLSEGFIRQGFKPIAHVESDKSACFTLKTRAAYHYLYNNNMIDTYNSYLKGEILRDHLYSYIPENILNTVINAEIGKDNEEIFKIIDDNVTNKNIDLILGGPPCQAYSKVGRAPLKHKINDERKTLYIQYGRFLKKYKPGLFVFENVPGILTLEDGKYFKNLQKYYKRIGYWIEAKTFNAYDYGVIQNRTRVIIIGWKKELGLTYPDIKPIVAGAFRDDIFYDLPAVKPGESHRIHDYTRPVNQYLRQYRIRDGSLFVNQHITRTHNENDLNIYKLAINEMANGIRLKNNNIPDNIRTQKNVTDFLDRFKVVDRIPHTIIAHIAKDGHHYIHPDPEQLRSISVREAARIQSFPDNYYFEGIDEKHPRTPAFKQIGNAVPPLMAEKIAEKIKEMLINE
ncbi:DNA cytosine methyltransferase [bacterium]|nr:DNA cytosine methyltransferase [bacterium]MBU1063401.1 DNA cytosine methyltransferase [bacterium]MBU1635254.1 DNA cytosine methyltransferase [bacterium]MBU1872201.1 DNA cytosine methyltransferase [bacterium]